MIEYDAVVVGAGPAGSTAAKIMAEAGFKILLIEKGEMGRKKSCAGGISIRTFEKLGISYKSFVEREISGVRMYSPNNSVIEHDYGKTTGITVYREKFDSYLLESAINAGAEVLTSSLARNILRTNTTNEIIIEKNKIPQKKFGKIIVAADGAFSSVSKASGLNNYPKNALAVCAQYEMEMQEKDIDELIGDKIELYFGDAFAPSGYGWIFPKKHGVTVGVGVEWAKRKSKMSDYLDAFVRRHPIVKEKLKKAKISRKTGGIVPLSGVKNKTFSNRMLIVGDAAGQVSPLTGEGIYYSMISAKIAASTVIEAISEDNFSSNKLEKYEKQWKKEIGTDLRYGNLLRNLLLSENDRVDYLVNEAKNDKCLRIMMADIITGAASYDEIIKSNYKTVLPFFLKGIIKGIYF